MSEYDWRLDSLLSWHLACSEIHHRGVNEGKWKAQDEAADKKWLSEMRARDEPDIP